MSESDSRQTLQEAMATLTAVALDGQDHPTPEELLAYHAGELSEEAHEHVRTHVAWCRDCARTVLDLASWPEVELREASLERTADEEAADWQAIRRRLADRDEAPGPAPKPPVRERPRARRRFYEPVHLLAAALLVAVVGLSFQLTRLTRQVAELTGPRANVFVTDLESVTAAARREGDQLRTTRVPDGMEIVVFLLVEDDGRPFDDHAVEIRDAAGRVFWRYRGLRSPPEGGFSVSVPVDVLPSDEIEIRLYGLADGDQELVATYRTRIGTVPRN